MNVLGYNTAMANAAAATGEARGRVEALRGIWSPQLRNRRDVFVYLPPGHGTGRGRYPVLYMQDGQNAFDAATAFAGRSWRAREAADAMAARGQRLIVVAVSAAAATPEGDGRLAEYSPFSDPQLHVRGRGVLYARFLVETLKPLIDDAYATLRTRAHTGLMGSSMGGLISLYTAVRHPEVFGAAAALSPSLWFAGRRIFPWVRRHPLRRRLRIHLDMWTRELESAAGAAAAVEDTSRMTNLLRGQGHEVRLQIAPGARHDEDAWARRLPGVLSWFVEGRGRR